MERLRVLLALDTGAFYNIVDPLFDEWLRRSFPLGDEPTNTPPDYACAVPLSRYGLGPLIRYSGIR